jgi:UTP-glucose-1-phosphate uridylyltransferase
VKYVFPVWIFRKIDLTTSGTGRELLLEGFCTQECSQNYIHNQKHRKKDPQTGNDSEYINSSK